ncbi:MAG: hypothetical protein LBS64_06205 [Spirochaetaceae bacterium]|jgi:hypothetical protein|nr:hypothetical protein [Spirochaetaceae bacterium]
MRKSQSTGIELLTDSHTAYKCIFAEAPPERLYRGLVDPAWEDVDQPFNHRTDTPELSVGHHTFGAVISAPWTTTVFTADRDWAFTKVPLSEWNVTV